MNSDFINSIISSYFSKYKFFLDGSYYSGVFQKYFSFASFVGGALIAIALFLIWVYANNDKTGLRHLIAGLVAIEVSPIIVNMINSTVGESFSTQVFDQYMNPIDNSMSGLLLVLIVYSTYRFDKLISFAFGLIAYLFPLLLNADYYVSNLGNKEVLFVVIQFFAEAIIMGLLCILICTRKYFFNSWIIYFVFHITSRCVVMVLNVWILHSFSFKEVFEGYLEFLSRHYNNMIIDILFFGFVMVLSILYEKTVFKEFKDRRMSVRN